MNSKSIQLFLLPFAGGNAASFKKIVELLDIRIEAIPIEYSGRGTRSEEPFAKDFESLITDVIEFIDGKRYKNIPYAILGYSMGSIATYEIIADKKINGDLKHVFLCAENSPTDKRDGHLGMGATDEEVVKRLIELGGINERLLHNSKFFEIFVRPSIVDFKILKQHQCIVRNSKIKSDATVMYCEKDTPYDTVKKWSDLLEGNIDFYEVGENHFFINQYYRKMAEIINYKLERYL